MSFAVMRGSPTAAQLYLDCVLEELVQETGRQEDRYCLNKIMYKCLRDTPDDIRVIEGGSENVDTNKSILEKSIPAALALKNEDVGVGDTVLIISRNSLEMISLYFGGIFAGVTIYALPPIILAHELKHFLNIQAVKAIFTEVDALHTVETAIENFTNIKIVVFGENNSSKYPSFKDFTYGYYEEIATFWPVDTNRDSSVIILPTSGSTGLPKAAVWDNKGVVAQLPTLWVHQSQFPKPTNTIMCTSNVSWATFHIAMTASAVLGITVLTTADKLTTEHTRTLIRKYKPTITIISVSMAAALISEAGQLEGDLSSFEYVYLSGSPVPTYLLTDMQRHLRIGARACSLYGLTEVHGCATVQNSGSSFACLGTIANQLEFKIVDDEGNKLGPNLAGELWLKSDYCSFKEYVNNEKATREAFEKDWFKTGDRVYMNEDEEIFFVERIKFIFKYQNYHISPTELEDVITRVEGVKLAVVCDSPKGPAALVVTVPGNVVKSEDIHDLISSTLSDVKRLRGGVAFVEEIPLLANGKIDRQKAKNVFEKINQNKINYDISQ